MKTLQDRLSLAKKSEQLALDSNICSLNQFSKILGSRMALDWLMEGITVSKMQERVKHYRAMGANPNHFLYNNLTLVFTKNS